MEASSATIAITLRRVVEIMRIFVKAKPGAKEAYVEAQDATHIMVSVVEPAQEGKANRAIVRALAQHLGIVPSRIEIVSGAAAKRKVIEIH